MGRSATRFDATSPEIYLEWINSKPPRKREAPEFEDRMYEFPGLHSINRAFKDLGIPHRLVLAWFGEHDEDGRKIDGTEKTVVYFEDSRSGVRVKPSEVGSGVSQVLPLVAAVELLREDVLLTVEQPELHLHPRLQARLGDYLVERAYTFHNDWGPIILETHSELLILRILRLIREGRVTERKEVPLSDGTVAAFEEEPFDLRPYIAVYYVGETSEGPQITQMRIGDDGEFIDEWPAGFFEERLDELF